MSATEHARRTRPASSKRIRQLEQENARLAFLLEHQSLRFEEMYRAIGESIPYGVWIAEPGGRAIYVSQSLLDLVGMTQQEFSGIGWGNAVEPDVVQRSAAAWQECVRTESLWNFEFSVRGKDGQLHPILARGVPVRGADGQVIAWAGINLDIGDIKRLQEDLLTTRARFELALRSAPIGVAAQDLNLRYTWIYHSLLGQTEEEIIGKTDEERLGAEEAAELVACKRSVLESGIGQRREFVVHDKRGVMQEIDVTIEPLRNINGSVTGVITAGMNVTDAKRREREAQENNFRSELRRLLLEAREQERLRLVRDMHAGPLQVLAALNLTMDVSRMALEDPAAREEMAELRNAVKTAMQESRELVGDLLWSLPQRVGLTRAIQLHTATFQAENPELEITCRAASDMRKLPNDVDLALFSVLQASLDNVAKHARATKASVTFSIAADRAVLEIRDNGIGMNKLANPLHLAQQGRYGMARMQERMDAVQGQLEIKSIPGKGTTVVAHVALEHADAPVGSRKLESSGAGKSWHQSTS